VLLLTLDANFRLKLKDKHGNQDKPLGDGWAHWVPGEDYEEYVKKYGYQQEVGSCLCIVHSWLTSNVESPICANLNCVQLIMQIQSFRRAIRLQGLGGPFVLGIHWYAKMDSAIYKKENGWQL
jgi:hypothetical protein